MAGCQGSNTGRWQTGADPLLVAEGMVGIRGRFAKAALVAFQVGAGGREGGKSLAWTAFTSPRASSWWV